MFMSNPKTSKPLNVGHLCYLRPEAMSFYVKLTQEHKLDTDLAIGVMERIFKDDELYELPPDDSTEE